MSRFTSRIGAIVATVVTALSLSAPPAAAASTVDGAGSTWSQIAVDQWRADVARSGLPINYQGVGSTSGRVFYYQGQADFAVSEIPFQAANRDATGTVVTNELEQAAKRPYAYLPIVAGGTSFMYHLQINGQRVNNLRLSPATLAKIFTGVITKWNHPEVKADNPSLPLPDLPIRPVIRSDGSGTSAQFTAFMASQTPNEWNAFCRKVGINLNPCPATSLYPEFPGSTAQQFSDGVAGFVAAPYNNGAITYVEYGYAKQRGFPVASVLNRSGYYIQPTPQAVAIALQGATLNSDGMQNLGGVYTHPDARAYPVSSYSYMIVPTTEAAPFDKGKGDTLSKFILYFVCAGQQKAAQLGYSPLPKNLVQVAFDAVNKIPGHVAPPPIGQCNNPTITGDFITGAAPPPPDDSKKPPASQNPGAQPGTNQAGQGGTQDPGGSPGTGSPSGGSGTGTGATGGAGTGSDGTTSPTVAGSDPGVVVDPATGEVLDTGSLDGQLVASASPVTPPAEQAPISVVLVVAVAIVALLAIFAPPAVALAMRGRSRTKS